MAKQKYVTASDVGRVAFCPRSVSLEKQGHKVSSRAKQRRRLGNNAHKQFNQEIKAKQRKPCFIATATFGESHPVTEDFRNFRDKHINSTAGLIFVTIYYHISPGFCVILHRFPALKKPVKALLLSIHKRLVNKS